MTAAMALTACGGGDDGTVVAPPTAAPAPPTSPAPTPPAPAPTPPAPPPMASTTVGGAVVKGPVAGAQVCAYTVVANARGAALGSCTTSDATGAYSFAVPAGSGPLWVEATGGSYTDEATGATASLPVGSALTSIVIANGGTVTTLLTPLTTLALNAAAASVGSSGSLNALAFSTAATQLLASFNLPATLDIVGTLPQFGTGINPYGTALTVISQMVANGSTLASILATTNPQTLAAAYAAAANPPPPAPPPPTGGAGGGTASGSVTSTGGVLTFVPRSAPGGTTPVFTANVLGEGSGLYSFFNYIRPPDVTGAYSLNGQSFNVTLIGGRLSSLIFIESGTAGGIGRNLVRFCPLPCAGATLTPTADGRGLTLALVNAQFEVDPNFTTIDNPPSTPIVMNGSLTGALPGN